MKIGTKSLLFGVHHFIFHPITVYAAWCSIYKSQPTWQETICIIIHDWGYWGKNNMDGEEGESHPKWAAKVAKKLFKYDYYYDLCAYHSRSYAKKDGAEPSKLCWADKYSIVFDPWWLYLPRAWATGELKEYRQVCSDSGYILSTESNLIWYNFIVARFINLVNEKVVGKRVITNV